VGVNGGDVELAAATMVEVLRPYASVDWQVPAGSLDWSCAETAAHVAHDLMAYAGQLAARATDSYLPFDLVMRDGTPPDRILQVVTACARLLSEAVAAAEPTTRAWHWGPTDATGFAALGVNEILVHTWDITQGLAIDWLPPQPPSAVVLARLFPDAPAGDPARTLLWCTGRAGLPGLPRRTSWIPRAAG
jgi:hypothetical protein